MKIEQFEDKGLAQYSYAILSESANEIVLIDPARDTRPYLDFAKTHGANILAVVLTHSHADFVSSHAELQDLTGAEVFVSHRMEATFPHQSLTEGPFLTLGKITLRAMETPGHSPDSISIILQHKGKDKAIFTGDTLFVGDVGRPDLRGIGENAARMREELARQMYQTIHTRLKTLPEDLVVYPGHGAGTLCGKSLSTDSSSTIGREIRENYAFQPRSEADFIEILLQNQSFIPKYFPFDVALNLKGAPALEKSLLKISQLTSLEDVPAGTLLIDTRPEKQFKMGHHPKAINLQNGAKFETWLGSIVAPEEKIILIADSKRSRSAVIRKAAKIGYEAQITATYLYAEGQGQITHPLPLADFAADFQSFTIVDVRDKGEVAQGKIFENSLSIPLSELRERIADIPKDKPIVVHCAGGYRSAAGSSLIQTQLDDVPVYDLGEAIKDFTKSEPSPS
jgi:glyoxylase-like metal-dependent hydrolase (beta-lactamase superfamily II)/rhodanese-related sulfurtransferase